MKKDNKRAFLRYPYSSSVMYTTLNYAVRTANEAETAARIVDLSDSGMRMLIHGATLVEGNMIRVRIQVSDIQASVPTLAEVIWTKKQNAKAYHAGLRFVV
ncbi:hypothetical protein NBG4_540019 [Candidatus Sulfobium mesophilum]|uniref:PilZ domain-containing protein n=1 Tax=Candidatus Sulfobium mesophilum TaxID=2016548 RepID=A0A2U3QJ89_9BACT|nr:hypothetical protein NBG4_540019 [Candidatus Sulfobium mesophilum]